MSAPRLIHGDNLAAMADLLAEGVRAHLIYADPPFFTQRAFYYERGGSRELAFDDRWPSLETYVEALRLRCVAARDLLTPDGCIVVHVDPSTSHYVKVMLDGVFGRECFANEIVWRYRRWPTPTPHFQGMHDVLLRYVRDASAKPRWTQLYEPLSAHTLKSWGGKKQRMTTDANGRHVKSIVGDQDSPGALLSDVWEIGVIAPPSAERTGYPTQKPEKLLDRLISACTHPGDAVLDPYCGSGTTLAVAHRLGREAIGIDAGDVAIRVASARLAPKREQIPLPVAS